MGAMKAVLPVFFLLALGFTARVCRWITPQQNEGAKTIVFQVLFPFLVFDVLFRADLKPDFLSRLAVADILWILLFLAGRLCFRKDEKFSRIAPFLLMTSEGGNVALPLYLTIVSSAHALNIITFDVGGILINFGLVPAIVNHMQSGSMDGKALMKQILRNNFMIAVLSGILLNLLGVHGWMAGNQTVELYTEVMDHVTAPIMGIILFTLGYELKLDHSMLRPILKLAVIRILGGFFIMFAMIRLFPDQAEHTAYRIAVILYFLCPPGFPVPLQVSPLAKSDEDEAFLSAFVSIYVLITLIAYTFISIHFANV